MPNDLAPPRSVVSRITAILSTFLSGGNHSVTEMARLTGLPVSTTHRIVADLAAWQLLHRMPDGQYRVGIILQQLGGDVSPGPVLHDRAPHVVMDLYDATHRRARLGVLTHGRVAYIEKRVGPNPVTSFSVSATLPAHATAVGKALLAFAPRETVAGVAQHLTAYTPNTLNTPDRLHRALGIVRLTRTAVSHGELHAGDSAVAAPVFGCGGEVIAALEVELHDLRGDIEVCKAALAVAARGLSRELAIDHDRADRPHLTLLPAPGAADALPANASFANARHTIAVIQAVVRSSQSDSAAVGLAQPAPAEPAPANPA